VICWKSRCSDVMVRSAIIIHVAYSFLHRNITCLSLVALERSTEASCLLTGANEGSSKVHCSKCRNQGNIRYVLRRISRHSRVSEHPTTNAVIHRRSSPLRHVNTSFRNRKPPGRSNSRYTVSPVSSILSSLKVPVNRGEAEGRKSFLSESDPPIRNSRILRFSRRGKEQTRLKTRERGRELINRRDLRAGEKLWKGTREISGW